jgi:uncharacterized protein (UPF0216 family)
MHAALKANRAGFAANVLPIIHEVQAAGHKSHNAIAGQLNARKVATARGGRWTHVQVGQILRPRSEVERTRQLIQTTRQQARLTIQPALQITS